MRKTIKTIAAVTTIGFATAAFGAVPPLQTTIVASGLDRPLFVTAPAGDSRLFIVEQSGAVKILQNGAVQPTPFLDLSKSVDTSGERGLLGMAFDPNFATNRRFYVDYIDKSTLNTVVATYQANASKPNIADAASGQTVLTVTQPVGLNNHKAGWIGFRPGESNNLYIATGDGGGANDPQNRAQNLNDNLGKILRADVGADRFPGDNSKYGYAIPAGNLTGGNPEIFAYGLRNPFRDSFDRQTGIFYIADVGQSNREEVNIGVAGANYGWRKFEGSVLNFPNDPPIANHTLPIHEYDHNGAAASITGGYAYRGSAIEGLAGTYFFADFVTGKVMSFHYTGAGITDLTDRTGQLESPTGISGHISSFGEDSSGNLYIVSLDGKVGMITAIPEPAVWTMMLAGMIVVSMWAAGARRRDKLRAAVY